MTVRFAKLEHEPIVAFLSPPTFGGGRITRARALALARDCEGDDLIDFGPLPVTYQSFSPGDGNWESPLSFESGYMYLVVGHCDDFHLYVLSAHPMHGR